MSKNGHRHPIHWPQSSFQYSVNSHDGNYARFTCLWTIDDYQTIVTAVNRGDYLYTDRSVTVFPDVLVFKLRLYPKGDEANNAAKFHLVNSEMPGLDPHLNIKMSLLDVNKMDQFVLYKDDYFESVKRRIKWFSNDFDGENVEKLLPNGKLQISVEGAVWAEEPDEMFCSNENFWRDSLQSSMTSLIGKGEHSDVTVLVGSESFQVHKVILAARSPVFETMFKEPTNNIITIENITPEVFKTMLHFIYTDFLTQKTSLLPDLLKAAHAYKLDQLKYICELKLVSNILTSNVLEYFQLANELGAKELQCNTLDYITENSESVCMEPSWRVLKSECSPAVAELLERLMEKEF